MNGGPDIQNKYGLFLGERTDNGIIYSTIVSKAEIKRNKVKYLPKYVFSYYSGVSNRLLEHFDPHQRRFYEELIKSDSIPEQRPFFYARLIHSYFVLMAFYSFSDSKVAKFMEAYLGILGLESMLFVTLHTNIYGLLTLFFASSTITKILIWSNKGFNSSKRYF